MERQIPQERALCFTQTTRFWSVITQWSGTVEAHVPPRRPAPTATRVSMEMGHTAKFAPQLITATIEVAHPRQIIFASFALGRSWRWNTTGPTPPSPVEKQNVNRLVPGGRTVLGVSQGHVRMAWPLSVSVLQASPGTIVNKLLRRHQ